MYRTAIANKKYFITVFVISSLLLALFTTILYRQYASTQISTSWIANSYDTLRRSRNVLVSMLDIETGQRGYLLTGSSSFLKPYNAAVQRMDTELDLLIADSADNPEQHRRLLLLREKIAKVKQILNAQLKKYGARGAGGVKIEDLQQSKKAMDEMRAAHQTFTTEELTRLQNHMTTASKKQRKYLFTLFLGCVIAICGMILANVIIFFLMARHRAARKELQESEDRFAVVMNNVNDGIFEYNARANTIYFSPSCKAMLGYNETEFPNTVDSFNQLLHPEDLAQTWEKLNAYVDRQTPTYTNMFRLHHKNGEWRWILARGVGTGKKNKKFDRVIGAHTDITEHKEREQELKHLNADMERFTYLASHDLRAPLVNLKGFTGEIDYTIQQIKPITEQMLAGLSAEQRETMIRAFERDFPESLGFMRSAVEKMDKLTTAILDLSRVGGREYHFAPANTNTLIKRCLDSFAYEISRRKITITCDDLPAVTTDSLSLEQIFSNILDNAIKYLDPQRPGEIHIGGEVIGGTTVFFVRDNGRGIAPDDRQKVFDIFRRAQNTGGVRGIGMGMPHVQAILRKLGGKIWFESDLGQGSVFYFSIRNNAMGIAA